jgi:hypothetical protein
MGRFEFSILFITIHISIIVSGRVGDSFGGVGGIVAGSGGSGVEFLAGFINTLGFQLG